MVSRDTSEAEPGDPTPAPGGLRARLIASGRLTPAVRPGLRVPMLAGDGTNALTEAILADRDDSP